MLRHVWIAVIIGVLGAAFGAGRAWAQQPSISGFPLSGPIPVFTPSAGDQTYVCGGGTYAIALSADRRSILETSVEGFRAGQQIFSGSGKFPEGAVPVDSRGFFDAYFPGREPGQQITLTGNLFGEGLGGLSFSASPSICGTFGFSLPLPGGLPDSGYGPASGSPTLPLMLAAGGLIAAAAAFTLRRRV